MTESEIAIKGLLSIRQANGDTIQVDGETIRVHEVVHEVVNALEKQIDKNVADTHKSVNDEEMAVYGADARFGNCPTCGELVCSVWNECYCGDCGQRLDWSDE